MRTRDEIQSEIAKLKALTPIGRFAEKTKRGIQLQIEELEYGVDQTSGEWDEMSEEEQFIVNDTLDWKEGRKNALPSKEWGGLVE